MRCLSRMAAMLIMATAMVWVQGFAPFVVSRTNRMTTATTTATATATTTSFHQQQQQGTAKSTTTTTTTTLSMATPSPPPADGSDRGTILLGLAFLVSVWVFTIPPEFRRAHFCTSEVCVENRLACYDCVTFGEWTHGVQEYYQNGGGISFDFSVAQETKDLWAGK